MVASSSLSSHGFCRYALAPAFSARSSLPLHVAGGHHDDRDHREVRVRPEPVQHDEAVAGGQAQIQNDQIRLMLERFADRGQPSAAKNVS